MKRKDHRIVYLKNKKNYGTFFSRNKGVLHANGEYVITIDPDDLLLNNILIKCYDYANRYKLDIIQFYHLVGHLKNNELDIINNRSGIVFQPETNI